MRNKIVVRRLIVASSALLASATLRAQVLAPLFVAPAVPTEISSIYDTYHVAPMWFRNGAQTPAVAQLVSILKRAPFDGFAEGPQLASQIEAAMAQAPTNRRQKKDSVSS